MPSRVIPDTLLDSEAWHALSDKAKVLYISLILMACDFGCVLLTSMSVARRAFAKRPGDAVLDKLIDELVSQDLLRLYFTDEEKPVRFGFLPNFRQRLKQRRARHPLPPSGIYEDDSEACENFKQNIELFKKLAPTRRQQDAHSAPTFTRSSLEVLSKPKEGSLDSEVPLEAASRNQVPLPLVAGAAASASPRAAASPDSSKGQGNGNKPERDDESPTERWARQLGIKRAPGERDGPFATRVALRRIEFEKVNGKTALQ